MGPERLPAAILLMGPTASGKTDLAMRIAERFAVEIVSVDSAQIYCFMDIGTAKPEPWMQARVPHHLIDIRDPTETYSAGQFRADALGLMQAITRRGNIPLLAGGTMLYFHALRQGLNDLPTANPEIRQLLGESARTQGWPALHAQLAVVDPAAAARINANDAQRIQRALEIFQLTGHPLSALTSGGRPEFDSHRLLTLALMPQDRARLHERIARRFDIMLAQGLAEEVRALRQRFALHENHNSMRCVGYRQAWEHLEGNTPVENFREKGTAATRQLAKRQMTWLRSIPDAIALDPFHSELTQQALRHVEAFLR
ncbi:MAG: tRNA (adenosine(37)-N6)-dimethylallyltransferase MiaA [Betaproteobacteria bacterium]|nr:tRNA (adenosine(37)-N6)-dimethylallyltransferase MiaA [Betaproteobacteria bacterium]